MVTHPPHKDNRKPKLMAGASSSLIYLHLFYFSLIHTPPCSATGTGSWAILLPSIGISAMHMQLLPNDRVVMFDRTDFGTSRISLPNAKCRHNSTDCSAHSVEYDVTSNSIRPLLVLTDFWCSSGALMPNGRLIQTGGWGDGSQVVRIYKSCDTCDWKEIQNGLNQPRWYATNHILPDNRQIIIGGRQMFNFEFYPKISAGETSYDLPFLVETNDLNMENNLYPFVFHNPDGLLFIFANNRAILFDYLKNKVVRNYPTIPGGQPRNYPSTGSAVLLPLEIKKGVVNTVEVLVCGGAPKGAFINALNGKFDRALDTCGRIKISDQNPQWLMETMPFARVLGDMLLLPNGHVLNINGVSAGVAGWELGRNPVLNPVVYRPQNQVGSRFEVQSPSTTPRLYHSTAVLLRDGRVLVGGSNPHDKYLFANVLYPTELSLEAFSPSYLDSSLAVSRPNIISSKTRLKMHYGKQMIIRFTIPGNVNLSSVSVTMIAPSFNTHSFSMNQRLLVLDTGYLSNKAVGKFYYTVEVTAPPSGNIAPAESMESGWETVQRRGKKRSGKSWATRVKEVATNRGKSPLKDDSIGGKAVTYYITNFPEIWSEDEIWKALRTAGNIVDLFIARRRNSVGRKFGFARFYGVTDTERDMDEKLRLKANVARFGRKEGRSKNEAPEATRKLKSVIVQEEIHGKGTYAVIVQGSDTKQAAGDTSKERLDSTHVKVIHAPVNIILPQAVREGMRRKLVGRLKDYAMLRGFQNSFVAEGWSDVACRYLGSLYILLEFKEERVALEYMRNEKDNWSQWFSSVATWNKDFRVQERITRICITGLPPQAWAQETFSEVAKVLGEVLEPERCLATNWDIHKGKVVVLTENMATINCKVDVIVDGTKFITWVKEEEFDPWFPEAHGGSTVAESDEEDDWDYRSENFDLGCGGEDDTEGQPQNEDCNSDASPGKTMAAPMVAGDRKGGTNGQLEQVTRGISLNYDDNHEVGGTHVPHAHNAQNAREINGAQESGSRSDGNGPLVLGSPKLGQMENQLNVESTAQSSFFSLSDEADEDMPSNQKPTPSQSPSNQISDSVEEISDEAMWNEIEDRLSNI
ncbi:hypothetical protein LXL04_008804 [Taraxacum kok-saghyz]